RDGSRIFAPPKMGPGQLKQPIVATRFRDSRSCPQIQPRCDISEPSLIVGRGIATRGRRLTRDEPQQPLRGFGRLSLIRRYLPFVSAFRMVAPGADDVAAVSPNVNRES